MYKTIVVGYDGSQPSSAALIEAANWVRRYGGKIYLVHAVFFDTEEFGIAPEQHEKRLINGEQLCATTKDSMSAEFGIKIESRLCEGEPHEVLLDTARTEKADLVVLGTYSRRGLNRLLMGSVTSQVIVRSPIDVLVVNKQCTECTGTYHSILVSYDGSGPSKKAVERACGLAKINGGTVTALYVIPRYEEMIGFFRTEGIEKSLRSEAEKIIQQAVDLGKFHGVTIEPQIAEGHTAEKIVDTTKRLKEALILMGSHGYHGLNKAILGSTAERVIVDAPCPVLIAR